MKDLSKDVVNHLAVDEAGEGQRVDNFLLRILKGVPKSHIYRILRSGEVRINRRRVRPDTRLAVGDDLRIPPVRVASPQDLSRVLPARPIALPILYEDEALIEADKRYLVLVRGRWRDAKRRVELPLAKFVTGGERQVRVEHAGGRMARTVFYRRRVWTKAASPVSLLEAELTTGRTHQIRVHLTHLGFPLAGDDKYGDFAWNRALAKQGLKRMFLHAWRLSLPHPTQKRLLTIESPLPPDLAGFVARLDEAQHGDGDG